MTQAVTPAQATSETPPPPTAAQIEAYKAKLTAKYDGVTDRQLLELLAHQSEYMAAQIRKLEALAPALEGLSSGGGMLSKLLGMGK